MIDEGHDFKPEWLRLATQMVDPDTNSLLVLFDDAQSIYDAKNTRKFSFSSVGIQAQGRTTVLRLNYRNTVEVLSLAYAFAKDFISPTDAEDDGVPLLRPQTGGRSGPPPILHQLANLREEAKFIASEFKTISKAGWPWREMAVVYRSRFIGEKVTQCLRENGIPVEWLGEAKGRNRFNPGEDSVKVMTMHSSKGLEFPVVAIPGLGYAPPGEAEPIEEARLLYVAMTRAMDVLLMTCHQESEMVARLKRARSQLAAAKA
jgi:superfamily I DNA/RNA helicase